jgi:hypothetical protein
MPECISREAWTGLFQKGRIGMRQVRKKNDLVKCFFDFKHYIIFFGGGYIGEFLMDVSFHHEYRGATCPAEIPTLGRRGDAQIVVVAVGGLQEVETNLRGLTMGIPPLERENVALHLQRYIVGVPESINSLLR